MKVWRRWLGIGLVLMITLASLLGCKQPLQADTKSPAIEHLDSETPKYVFLFIGDGMSYAQVQAAALYLGASHHDNGTAHVNFMDFDVTGCIETYDSTSCIPDSASSGTAIATGEVTVSGRIGMDASGMVAYPSIAEKLKAEKGYKIGIVSTVYLNHATPAVFYSHQQSRSMYYAIGLDLIESGFDYFGGGGLYDIDNGGTSENLYVLAQAVGYNVADTKAQAEALTKIDGRALVVAPPVDQDTVTVPYRMDAAESDWSLADYVEKGIEMLDNDTGYFMMVESGKIDWACHANDSNATVSEVLALSDAVQVAVDFYNLHPDETLILVTADHETGGMSLGNVALGYVLYPKYLQRQTMSFTKYNNTYIPVYKENKTSYETVLADIETVFGLVAKKNATDNTDPNLVMTDAEYNQLYDAYQRTVGSVVDRTVDDDLLYSAYEPLTVTANHILNRHIGVAFASYVHTASPLPIYAHGVGAAAFAGVYHSTGIYERLAGLMGLTGIN